MLIKVLSYNISGGNRSARAPPGFTLADKYAAIAALIARHAPHLVALQEVQGLHHDEDTLQLQGMVLSLGYDLCSLARSHCGVTCVFVAGTLASSRIAVPPAVGPAALVRLRLGSAPDVIFAGVHLSPFGEGAGERLRQLRAIVAAAERQRDPAEPPLRLLIAGDCNMRKAEEDAVAQLGLTDAFLATEAARPNRRVYNFTFDTKRNLYHGPDAFQFNARFDRVLFRGLTAVEFKVDEGGVLAQPGHFLSDHFAVVCSLEV